MMIPYPCVRLAALAALLLTGCVDPLKPSPGDTDDSSTGTSASTADVPTTTVPTGTESSSGSESSSGTDTGTSTGTDTGTDTGTTGAVACDLVELTDEAAELLGPVQDCGTVSFYDHTVEQWQTARDCALAAAAGQQPFKLITWVESLDSEVGDGYFGVAAESYALAWIHFDSYPPPIATHRNCTALVASPDCEVAPGNACLTCEGADEGTALCGG